MSLHKKLPASGTKQWSICAGYAAWMEAHPELVEGSGYYAQMGTSAHVLVERCLREGSEPSEYEGRIIEIINPDTDEEGASILKEGAKIPKGAERVWFLVDQEMYEAVECMTDYIRQRCYELGLLDHVPTDGNLSMAEATAKIVGKTLHLEVKVNPLPDRDDTGGTADAIIDAWPDVLETVDYKNGSGVFVPVEGNEQLKSYELGQLVTIGPAALDYDLLRYTICQPRHHKAPPDGIMSEDTTPQDLLEWQGWLAAAADRVDDARAAVAAGADLDDLYAGKHLSVGEDGSHCQYCELQDDCPAARAKAQEMISADFDDDPEEIETPESHNHLSVLLPWAPFLAGYAKRITDKSEELMLGGQKIDGQKIVRKRSSGRKFVTVLELKDEDGVVQETSERTEDEIVELLAERFDLTEDQVRPTKTAMLTGPQIEKLLPKSQREGFSEEFLYSPPGALTIAPESDPRPEYVPDDPADDFDDDDED